MTPDYHDSLGAEFSSGQISPVREAAMGISTDTFYSLDLKPNQKNFDPPTPPHPPYATPFPLTHVPWTSAVCLLC